MSSSNVIQSNMSDKTMQKATEITGQKEVKWENSLEVHDDISTRKIHLEPAQKYGEKGESLSGDFLDLSKFLSSNK